MEKLNFRVSSALKNIIGKELITDKYIAIFELVKNSFDAYAERVDIIFEDDRIIIKDNGKGMAYDDIKNKWLFVGYSAKADNTENRGYKDYRNKIETRSAFAGAKGVGRFACDRLGKNLSLTSLKEEKGAMLENIQVSWEFFENDSTEDFINIPVEHRVLKENIYSLDHGTVIEIIDLREAWGEDDVIKLKTQLERLINPMQDNAADNFEIFITYKGKIDKVENFIFEKLELKTTHITVEFSKNGEYITTELVDRGEVIYRIKEKNNWQKYLYDIKIVLFYLSPPVKAFFKKQTGVHTVSFGSMFLYKNGFRVFPFGEEGEDTLKLDRRKAQGYARYLGTRDLFGRIEINNLSDGFKETSSRDGGLIETIEYKTLKEAFFNKCLKRLEKYTIDTLNWTYQKNLNIEFFPREKEKEIKMLIEKLVGSSDFIEEEFSYSLPDTIEKKTEQGFHGNAKKIKQEADKMGNIKLSKAVTKIEKSYKVQEEKVKKAEEKVERTNKVVEAQTTAMKSVMSQEQQNLLSYHHQISICSDTVKNYLDLAIKRFRAGKYDKLEDFLQKAKKENSKVTTIARFATKGDVLHNANKSILSLNNFIYNYIQRDYKEVASDGLLINIKDNLVDDFMFEFRPFEISLILDNFLDNAKKASSTEVSIELYGDQKILEIQISDNGKGLIKEYSDNPLIIFEPKVSSTDGSGWGLYHVKELLDKFSALITVEDQDKGLKIILTFNKEGGS